MFNGYPCAEPDKTTKVVKHVNYITNKHIEKHSELPCMGESTVVLLGYSTFTSPSNRQRLTSKALHNTYLVLIRNMGHGLERYSCLLRPRTTQLPRDLFEDLRQDALYHRFGRNLREIAVVSMKGWRRSA